MQGDGTRTGAQESVPPWEQPGCFRMDCEPHRGELLRGLAVAGLTIAILSAFPLSCVGNVFVLPLSLTVWVLARRDLARMRRGLMDPRGEALTEKARELSFIALAMSVLAPALVGISVLVLTTPPR